MRWCCYDGRPEYHSPIYGRESPSHDTAEDNVNDHRAAAMIKFQLAHFRRLPVHRKVIPRFALRKIQSFPNRSPMPYVLTPFSLLKYAR